MKKKSLKILLIIIILLVIMFVVFYLTKSTYLSVIGIIVKKDDEKITIKDTIDTTQLSYDLYLDEKGPIIKDINGKRIDLSNLNIGDKIEATYKKEEITKKINFFPERKHNIKLIKVIDDNSDNHLTEEDLSYNYFDIFSNLSKENLVFNIQAFKSEEFSPNGLSIKIVKKDVDNKEIEVKKYESSEISYTEYEPNTLEIIINNCNYEKLGENLEIGKYILRIENDEKKTIKLPFEKNQNGLINGL